MKTKLLYFFLIGFLYSFTVSSQNVWQKKTSLNKTEGIIKQHLEMDKVHFFELDFNTFKQNILNAPLRGSNSLLNNTQVALPAKNGEIKMFTIYEAPVFSPELSVLYPNIKSYVGYANNDNSTQLRMSVSHQGVQTMITYKNQEANFMMPESHGSNEYILYTKSSRGDYVSDFVCSTVEDFDAGNRILSSSNLNRDADDQLLRTYRLAVSVNGEYTQYHGGSVADALAAINATITRVNAVFEVDMAINFQIVSANQLIFTDPATDPYSNNLGNWNAELQAELTANLGEANYDIGHMFGASGGGGSAGCIGCVCEDGSKGSGKTSPADGIPQGDNFDIDYVAHEIGHQMGANHTFSHNTEGTGVNSEPGSGTTIMGYAGITGANNVQQHSDAYFHYHSINQILNNVDTSPNDCAVTTSITNNPPVANAGIDYVIPMGTAFILKGTATDADGGDTLSYSWEQIDSQQTTSAQFGPTHTGPVWRSRPPNDSPNRYMPILSRVLDGELTETNPSITTDNSSWETVSNISRSLNFALTVRDRAAANGVGQMPQSSFDTMQVTVDGTSGPFAVTSQSTNVTWDAGSTQTITWDVAGTDVGAVNTPTVNILLSIDGGLTFPFTMASNVPNDGTHDVTVPITGGDTTMARVIVEGNNNIFYAVNSTDFSIQESEFVISVSNSNVDVCQPSDAVYNFTYNTFLGFSDPTIISVVNLPTGAIAVVNPTTVTSDGATGTVTVSNTGSLATGSYVFTIQGQSGTIIKSTDVTLNVFNSTVNNVTLMSPVDGAVDVASDALLTWDIDVNTEDYLVEIATDAGFATIVETASVQSASYTATNLNTNTQYFWRVTASNQCGISSPSSVFNFTTANISCNNVFTATDTPITIAASGSNANYLSVITIAEDLPITDVNVKINIEHDWNNDLDIFLISPSGTIIELSTDNGVSGDDDYINTVFDQEATTSIVAGTSPFTGSFIPEGDLSTLYGETTVGDWTLSVDDDFGPADGGTILEFTLEFCVQGSLSVDEVNPFLTNFNVYPNPNNGSFNVKLNSVANRNVLISVFDISGRQVFSNNYKASTEFNEVINLDNVQSGMYMLQVSDGVNLETRKVIIN